MQVMGLAAKSMRKMVIMTLTQDFFKTEPSQRSTRNGSGQCSDSVHVLVFRGRRK